MGTPLEQLQDSVWTSQIFLEEGRNESIVTWEEVGWGGCPEGVEGDAWSIQVFLESFEFDSGF